VIGAVGTTVWSQDHSPTAKCAPEDLRRPSRHRDRERGRLFTDLEVRNRELTETLGTTNGNGRILHVIREQQPTIKQIYGPVLEAVV